MSVWYVSLLVLAVAKPGQAKHLQGREKPVSASHDVLNQLSKILISIFDFFLIPGPGPLPQNHQSPSDTRRRGAMFCTNCPKFIPFFPTFCVCCRQRVGGHLGQGAHCKPLALSSRAQRPMHLDGSMSAGHHAVFMIIRDRKMAGCLLH